MYCRRVHCWVSSKSGCRKVCLHDFVIIRVRHRSGLYVKLRREALGPAVSLRRFTIIAMSTLQRHSNGMSHKPDHDCAWQYRRPVVSFNILYFIMVSQSNDSFAYRSVWPDRPISMRCVRQVRKEQGQPSRVKEFFLGGRSRDGKKWPRKSLMTAWKKFLVNYCLQLIR
jgi:hypothetical protein